MFQTKENSSQSNLLGVILDKNITWKHHINIVNTKVCKGIGILYRTHHIPNK